MTIAIIAENAVIALAIVTGGLLFRQGGGWQFKTPPVPKAPPQPQRDAAAAPADDAQTGPLPFVRTGT